MGPQDPSCSRLQCPRTSTYQVPHTFQCLADLRWSLLALLEVPTSCSVGFPIEQRDQHAWRWPWPRPDDTGTTLSTPTIRAHLGGGCPPVPLRSWGRGTGRANPTCAPGTGQNRPLQTGHCSPQTWPRGAGAPTPRKHCALASEEDTRPSRAPLCRSPRPPASLLPTSPAGGPDSCSHPSTWCCPACPGRRPRSFPLSLWDSEQVSAHRPAQPAQPRRLPGVGGDDSPWSGSQLCRAAERRQARPGLQAV